MRQVIALFGSRTTPDPGAPGTTLLAFQTGQPLETLLPAIQQALGADPVTVVALGNRSQSHRG